MLRKDDMKPADSDRMVRGPYVGQVPGGQGEEVKGHSPLALGTAQPVNRHLQLVMPVQRSRKNQLPFDAPTFSFLLNIVQ
ncbi:MAG: hypothetical protein ACJ8AI_09170 [Rhodopila sp.]